MTAGDAVSRIRGKDHRAISISPLRLLRNSAVIGTTAATKEGINLLSHRSGARIIDYE